jgi:hypothetical protein
VRLTGRRRGTGTDGGPRGGPRRHGRHGPCGRAPLGQRSMSSSGLHCRSRVVAMVCDGVNDPAALAQADLGRSMGTDADADVAIEASDRRCDPPLPAHPRPHQGHPCSGAFAYNVAALPWPLPDCSARCWPGCHGVLLGVRGGEQSPAAPVPVRDRARCGGSPIWGRDRWRRSRLDLHAGVNHCSSLPSKALVVSR